MARLGRLFAKLRIKGQRYLTKKVRRATPSTREREEFLERLRQIGEQKNSETRKSDPRDDE